MCIRDSWWKRPSGIYQFKACGAIDRGALSTDEEFGIAVSINVAYLDELSIIDREVGIVHKYRCWRGCTYLGVDINVQGDVDGSGWIGHYDEIINSCLLYTSDAADERSSVDLGGRRIIKKKTIVLHDTVRLQT